MISKFCQLFNSERASVCQIRLSLCEAPEDKAECQDSRQGGLACAQVLRKHSFSREHKGMSNVLPSSLSARPFYAMGQRSPHEHLSTVTYAPAWVPVKLLCGALCLPPSCVWGQQELAGLGSWEYSTGLSGCWTLCLAGNGHCAPMLDHAQDQKRKAPAWPELLCVVAVTPPWVVLVPSTLCSLWVFVAAFESLVLSLPSWGTDFF